MSKKLIRSPRGALVYVIEDDKRADWGGLLPWIILAIFGLFVFFWGLPGDPMHGASKYQAAQECAGYIECSEEWGEEGDEEDADGVTVYDYRGRA